MLTAEVSPQATSGTKAPHAASSPASLWTGRVLSGLVVLFLASDAAMKVARLPLALEGTSQLGYPVSVVPFLSLIHI